MFFGSIQALKYILQRRQKMPDDSEFESDTSYLSLSDKKPLTFYYRFQQYTDLFRVWFITSKSLLKSTEHFVRVFQCFFFGTYKYMYVLRTNTGEIEVCPTRVYLYPTEL